jgi:putative membrane protein
MNLSNLIAALFFLLLAGCASSKDSVHQALQASDAVAPDKSRYDAQFLVEMTDARLMDFQEGRLAAHYGTTPAIRAYGRKMEHDQTVLLADLKRVAAETSVVLPKKVGAEKTGPLEDLRKLRGKKFDRTFISMITIDHRRDVEEFKKASTEISTVSQPVRDFAAAKLPLIQSHLDGAESLGKP